MVLVSIRTTDHSRILASTAWRVPTVLVAVTSGGTLCTWATQPLGTRGTQGTQRARRRSGRLYPRTASSKARPCAAGASPRSACTLRANAQRADRHTQHEAHSLQQASNASAGLNELNDVRGVCRRMGLSCRLHRPRMAHTRTVHERTWG
jgi:hypothetical protein